MANGEKPTWFHRWFIRRRDFTLVFLC